MVLFASHARWRPARLLLPGVFAAVFLVGGCGIRNAKDAEPVASPAPAAVAGDGGFSVAESMNDTWNTVGQVLVRLDGVAYESRSQMLGIHAVRYRGERMLILTRAVVLRDAGDTMSTRVLALQPDGKPDTGPAAVELLDLLARRVPLEALKYRQPVLPKKRTKK
jgi:hypothetical protein